MLTVDDDFNTEVFTVYNYFNRRFSSVPVLNKETGNFEQFNPLFANYEQAFRIDRNGNCIVGVGTSAKANFDVRGNIILGNESTSLATNSHQINGTVNFFTPKIRFRSQGAGLGVTALATNNFVELNPSIEDFGSINFNVGSTTSTTIFPHNLLSITNNVVGSLFRVNEINVSFASTTNLTTATIAPIFEVNSNNNVGIATTLPTAKFHVVGNALITGITTVGLGSTSLPTINSTMSFELTNNTTLTIRVKGTDGLVRTGIITLA